MATKDTNEDRAAEFEGSLSPAERYELFHHKERDSAIQNEHLPHVLQHNRNAALWAIASELAAIRETLASLHFVVRTPVGPGLEKAVELANEGKGS